MAEIAGHSDAAHEIYVLAFVNFITARRGHSSGRPPLPAPYSGHGPTSAAAGNCSATSKAELDDRGGRRAPKLNHHWRNCASGCAG